MHQIDVDTHVWQIALRYIRIYMYPYTCLYKFIYVYWMHVYIYVSSKNNKSDQASGIRDSECLVGFNAWSDLLFLLGISKYVYDYMTLLIH
jgi:hypothetical protein